MTIEAPSHLIRMPGRRVRVLRLAIVDGHCEPFRYRARRGRGTCRQCGCTNDYACYGGCSWFDSTHRLCTRCAALYPLLCDDGGEL